MLEAVTETSSATSALAPYLPRVVRSWSEEPGRVARAHVRRIARLGRHLRLHRARRAAAGEGQGGCRGARPENLGRVRRPHRRRRATRRRRAQVPRRRAAAALRRRAARRARLRSGLRHAVDDRGDRDAGERRWARSSCGCRWASIRAGATCSSPMTPHRELLVAGPGGDARLRARGSRLCGRDRHQRRDGGRSSIRRGSARSEDGARLMIAARAGCELDPAPAGRARGSTCDGVRSPAAPRPPRRRERRGGASPGHGRVPQALGARTTVIDAEGPDGAARAARRARRARSAARARPTASRGSSRTSTSAR